VVAIHFVFTQDKARNLVKNQPQLDEFAIHKQLQRQSNSCFESFMKQKKVCTPKKSQKCKFCTTRGRMFAKQIVDSLQGRLPT
jgi:hypothetical protein